MRRPTAVVLIGVLAASAALGWWLGRARREARSPTPPATAAEPTPPGAPPPPAAPPLAALRAVEADDDPGGALRLEGLVLDADELPVAAARVRLDSRPPRTATTGRDGSFAFDALPPRGYRLIARTADAVGGPIAHRLTATSPPAVMHLRGGATLEVAVVARTTGAPLAQAQVGVDGELADTATADRRGRARFTALAPGGYVVLAQAPGYARRTTLLQIPSSPGASVSHRIELDAGAPVSGRVLDPSGAPIVGARVVGRLESALVDPASPARDGVDTDAQGRFAIPALAAGTYRFEASHERHPPAVSEPLAHDGISERSDVVIVMEPGGRVTGRVVDAEGRPAPYAQVRIGVDPRDAGAVPSAPRQVLADDAGRFELAGLPRAALAVSATSELATSELVGVDLRRADAGQDVLVRLDVTGAIAGVVVDAEGEPVADAQVTAFEDIWTGGELAQLIHRGERTTVSDGDGGFALRGLPPGPFRLRASRAAGAAAALASGRGVSARTGDTGVRLTLSRPGGVSGRIQLSSGDAPSLATVEIGIAGGVPADAKGAFRVDGIEPGTYELALRGPEFPDRFEREVKVEADTVTELGTIVVARGRSVSGVVRDRAGRAVGGAHVVVGRQLIGDGARAAIELGDAVDERLGVRRTLTQADGSFRIAGVSAGALVAVAEHDERGRSPTTPVAAGDADATLELRLVPLGSIVGRVTLDGKPTAGAVVATTPGGGPSQLTVRVAGDGAFAFERVAAGSYKLTAVVGSGLAAKMAGRAVEVPTGERVEVALEVSTGNVALEVSVTAEPGATIDSAQVFLFRGKVEVARADQVQAAFTAPDTETAGVVFASPAKPARFQSLVPGAYSVCVIPLTGDMNDPAFLMRVQRHATQLAVYCRAAEVADSPAEQRLEVVSPGMNPLPE